MQYVKYDKRGMTGLITIDRQDVLNALNMDILEELDGILDGISLGEVRCVILTGAGNKAFVAGADIGSMVHLSKEKAVEWSRFGNAVFCKLEQLCVPVIAAVNGYALGGGCELALACDIRLAAENAVFAQPEVSLGVTAGYGGTQRLPRLIGCSLAKELLFTGARIDAAEAYRIGLVSHVYSSVTLMDESFKLAEKISANAPIAVRATKKAVNLGMEKTLSYGLEAEADLFGDCFESADQLNAMTAFLNKEKPEPFVNR